MGTPWHVRYMEHSPSLKKKDWNLQIIDVDDGMEIFLHALMGDKKLGSIHTGMRKIKRGLINWYAQQQWKCFPVKGNV